LKKQDRKPTGQGEKKLREMRKTNQQLKAQIKQLRKALTLTEERVIQLQDELGSQDVVETARKIARGKRKRLSICGTCSMQSVEEFITDLGAREMVVKACNSCGEHFGRSFRKKDI
jgi:hypothetical protein